MTWEMLREMDAHGIITGATRRSTPCSPTNAWTTRGARSPVQGVAGEGAPETGPAIRLLQRLLQRGRSAGAQGGGLRQRPSPRGHAQHAGIDPFALKRKVLWENSSAGVLGFYSKPLIACQFENTTRHARAAAAGDGRAADQLRDLWEAGGGSRILGARVARMVKSGGILSRQAR